MKVDHVIQLEDGVIQFQGTLKQEEADIVIQMGLAVLYNMGAIKGTTTVTEGAVMEGNDTLN